MINMLAITFTLTYWCHNIYNFLFAASGLDASLKDLFSHVHLQEKEILEHPSQFHPLFFGCENKNQST